jgi:hypothetical protein
MGENNSSTKLSLSETQITELAHIGSKYLYQSVTEEGRISELGVLAIIEKYLEYASQHREDEGVREDGVAIDKAPIEHPCDAPFKDNNSYHQ